MAWPGRRRSTPLVLALAGLLVVSGAVIARAQAERTVEVRLHHSRFVVEDLEFRAGETVNFVITNDDPIDHEFIVGDQGVQDRHEKGSEPVHVGVPTEMSVAAGKTAQTTITFPEKGDLILGCHLPGHFAYGMRVPIKVW